MSKKTDLKNISSEDLIAEVERRRAEAELKKQQEREQLRKQVEEKRKTALKEIEAKLKEAKEAIASAEAIADAAQVTFYFSVEYGMGGTYHPKRLRDSNQEAVMDEDDDDYYRTEGWSSSSTDC